MKIQDGGPRGSGMSFSLVTSTFGIWEFSSADWLKDNEEEWNMTRQSNQHVRKSAGHTYPF
jgi:hypothetical protein